MDTIRLSNDFVSPAISKADPKITLNQKPHQHITAEIESYWEQTKYNDTFELAPKFLRNKLHLYVTADSGYTHGQLSWTPSSFINGSNIDYDLTVDVTDAQLPSQSIPEGYEDYYLYDSANKFYEDVNYDNYTSKSNLSSKVIMFDLEGCLNQNNTTFSSLFDGANQITHLDLSNWDVSKVSSFLWCFGKCSSLVSLNLTGWNISSAESLGSMFNSCSSLSSLDLTNFNTTNVTEINYTFSNCSALTSLDLSTWNTCNVTKMGYTFICSNLRVLDISDFDTSKVTWMPSMISSSCRNLKYLIIGSNTFKFQLKSSDAVEFPSNCKILVPSALISTYQNGTNSSAHASKFDAIENYNIVRSNGQVTVTPKNA